MTAKVAILTATSEQALTVPIQAVVKRALGDDGKELKGSSAKGIEKKDVVYRVEDDTAQAHTVTLASRMSSRWRSRTGSRPATRS